MATHSSEPQFLCRSPGPACQSCRVLRLLQSLQVDSLMLQEWLVLQPLSWTGNPQQGGGDMQHGCTSPASCACPLSPKKTIYPSKGQALLLQREAKTESSTPSPATPGTQPLWENTLVPGRAHLGPLLLLHSLHSCLPRYRRLLASIRFKQELPPNKPPPTKAAIPPGTHVSLYPPMLEAPLGEGKGHLTEPWLYMVDSKQVTVHQLSLPPPHTVLLNTPEQLSEYSSIK